MRTTNWFVSTHRLAFLFSLDNSGALKIRKWFWLSSCWRGRIITFVRSEMGLSNRPSTLHARSPSLNRQIHRFVWESESVRSPSTKQSFMGAALCPKLVRKTNLRTVRCSTDPFDVLTVSPIVTYCGRSNAGQHCVLVPSVFPVDNSGLYLSLWISQEPPFGWLWEISEGTITCFTPSPIFKFHPKGWKYRVSDYFWVSRSHVNEFILFWYDMREHR
jgi:hypothetical protein